MNVSTFGIHFILQCQIMALTGFRIGTNPEELAKIKAEFAENYSE